MADDVSLELWMDKRRLAALERVMNESGTDTQTVMQARFDELYRQYVPAQERTDINNAIEGERLATERRAEENDSFAIFHVHENGFHVAGGVLHNALQNKLVKVFGTDAGAVSEAFRE